MKNIYLILIIISLFTSCIIGDSPEPVFTLPSSADPSSDVILNFTERLECDIEIKSNSNYFYYKEKENYSFIGYNGSNIDTLKYQEQDNTNLKVFLPINITSNKLYILQKGTSETKKYWVNAFSNFVKINYPKTMTISKNRAAIGEEVTITSTKPFFDEATFTKDKLQFLLDRYYYIVWIDAKEVNYIFDEESEYNEYGSPLKSISSENKEKYPVMKEYYVIDKITPYSITFKIPPYAKSGIVHILNEGGFPKVIIPWMSEMQPEQRLHEPLVPKNEVAYYSTSEELIILDDSGNEIR